MGRSNSRCPSRLILLYFLISSQFWGLSLPSSIIQHNLEGFEDPEDGSVLYKSIPNSDARIDKYNSETQNREKTVSMKFIVQENVAELLGKLLKSISCRMWKRSGISYRVIVDFIETMTYIEEHKLHSDINEWRCGFCKKAFYEEKYLDKHFDSRHYNLLNASHGKCLADLCGALHCDLVVDTTRFKSKCNPAAAARNRHLCESLANSCFPVNKGPSANRLHDFFLRQFCDAHTCSGGSKPLSKKPKKRSMLYIIISVITLILLLLYYSFVYLFRRGLRSGTQELKRIRHSGLKKKPS